MGGQLYLLLKITRLRSLTQPLLEEASKLPQAPCITCNLATRRFFPGQVPQAFDLAGLERGFRKAFLQGMQSPKGIYTYSFQCPTSALTRGSLGVFGLLQLADHFSKKGLSVSKLAGAEE